jgi:hypothetical protein
VGRWRGVEIMADEYYITTNTNGDREVHREGCRLMPEPGRSLGRFETCHGAVAEARRSDHESNGCYFCCCPACHEGSGGEGSLR